MYKYLSESNNAKTSDDLGKKANTLKCLKETFENYGGVFSKLAQMLCFEDNSSDSKVFSECKPVNMGKTIEYLQNEFKRNYKLFENVNEIDFNVFRSGSVGQVHKAKLKNGKDIVIKVQYVGLEEQMVNDLKILEQIINFLYSFADLTSVLKDIKVKLAEELDYTNEAKNQKRMYDLWKDNEDSIRITELIPNICSKNILGMYYVEGESLNDFILTATQEEKNSIAKKLVKFIFVNIYKNGIFYSDIHYGNFLITDKTVLNVMDFGCLNEIDEKLVSDLKRAYRGMIKEDKESFYEAVKSIGIIKDGISEKSKEYVYKYWKMQYTPWMEKDFHFTNDFLTKSVEKDTSLMREWGIPPGMVYLNKIPYGLFHILTKLNASGDFSDIFVDLILNA